MKEVSEKDYRVHSDESEGVRFAKLFAEMFYYMSKNVLETLGDDEGSALIAKAVREFGKDRVESMQTEAHARGLGTVGMSAVKAVRDMPNCGWEYGVDENGHKYTSVCLFNEVWKRYGEMGQKVCSLYCPIDFVIDDGFGMDLERIKCKGCGDDVCYQLHHVREEKE